MRAHRSSEFSLSILKKLVFSILLLFLLTTPAWEQNASNTPPSPASASQPNQASPAQSPPPAGVPPSPSQPAGSSPTQVPGAGISVEGQQPSSAGQEPSQKPPEKPAGPITKQQAKELFRSVDQILQFASNDTGLPIEHSVKRKLITRQSVENYVEKRMRDDKDTQRLEQSQAILVKFGLLPQNFNLQTEYLNLLREQVAAYYDPRTKTVNLLDWVPPDQQKPVLAHELTHALQDQQVGLEKWELAGGKDDKPLPDNQEEVVEEAQSAREAVLEGQAMIVFLDYSLAPLGMNVLKAPDVFDAMRSEMGQSEDSPLFSAAPMYLQESLLMPYTFGSDFERYVLEHKGKEAAFEGVLDRPPVDTRQIMEPETYLANDVVAPLKIPDLDKLVGPQYERYDFGGMGEFDVYLLMKQYAPDDDPKNIYTHWRGGYYLADHAKTAPKDQISLLYLSRWDSPESAQAFAKVYEAYTPKRYPKWSQTGRAPETGTSAAHGLSEWWEGPESDRVYVDQSGRDLLILESFDEATAQRLSTALLPGESSAGKSRPTPPPSHSQN
jgi:hypothetical protein